MKTFERCWWENGDEDNGALRQVRISVGHQPPEPVRGHTRIWKLIIEFVSIPWFGSVFIKVDKWPTEKRRRRDASKVTHRR